MTEQPQSDPRAELVNQPPLEPPHLRCGCCGVPLDAARIWVCRVVFGIPDVCERHADNWREFVAKTKCEVEMRDAEIARFQTERDAAYEALREIDDNLAALQQRSGPEGWIRERIAKVPGIGDGKA